MSQTVHLTGCFGSSS